MVNLIKNLGMRAAMSSIMRGRGRLYYQPRLVYSSLITFYFVTTNLIKKSSSQSGYESFVLLIQIYHDFAIFLIDGLDLKAKFADRLKVYSPETVSNNVHSPNVGSIVTSGNALVMLSNF